MEVDLDESYNVFRYYAGAADKICGNAFETSPAKLAYMLQEPLGVCGQIIPWSVLSLLHGFRTNFLYSSWTPRLGTILS